MTTIPILIKESLSETRKELASLYTANVETASQILSYLSESEGKLIRPILVLLASHEKQQEAIGLASAIELIHIASLLHDDVIDEADIRRGKEAINARWGEKWAVLVGDFLLSTAFNIILKEKDWRIFEIFTRTSLIMTEGEMAELEAKNSPVIDEAQYLSIVYRKTASLFASSGRVGAIIGGRPEEPFADYGKNLGFAFQITDDLLDISSKNPTKSIGQDIKNGRLTLPFIHSLKEAKGSEKKKILELISANNLSELKRIVERYGGIEYSQQLAEKYIEEAKSCLKTVSPSPYKDSLFNLADSVRIRVN
ncbi:MAG: polyprenyl synthetase family protein [bacterium]|nr:polyprenyl synthetase family protein [bacterium]